MDFVDFNQMTAIAGKAGGAIYVFYHLLANRFNVKVYANVFLLSL
jgi:hypothetical protein